MSRPTRYRYRCLPIDQMVELTTQHVQVVAWRSEPAMWRSDDPQYLLDDPDFPADRVLGYPEGPGMWVWDGTAVSGWAGPNPGGDLLPCKTASMWRGPIKEDANGQCVRGRFRFVLTAPIRRKRATLRKAPLTQRPLHLPMARTLGEGFSSWRAEGHDDRPYWSLQGIWRRPTMSELQHLAEHRRPAEWRDTQRTVTRSCVRRNLWCWVPQEAT